MNESDFHINEVIQQKVLNQLEMYRDKEKILEFYVKSYSTEETQLQSTNSKSKNEIKS